MPDLLNAVQAAEVLGLTPDRITQLARSGELPHAHKNPGRTGAYIFDAAVVRLYLRSKRPRAQQGAGARTRSRQSEEATAS